jgi:hypothetical protein
MVGACIKHNRQLTVEKLSQKLYKILQHICGCYENCNESLCDDKEAEQKILDVA